MERMIADPLHARGHELLDQLEPGKLEAVVRLLECMVDDDVEDEEISAGEEAAVARSKQWFEGNEGIPIEQVAAELGLTMDQIRGVAEDPAA